MRKVTFKAMRWSHVNGTLVPGFGGVDFVGWIFVLKKRQKLSQLKSGGPEVHVLFMKE